MPDESSISFENWWARAGWKPPSKSYWNDPLVTMACPLFGLMVLEAPERWLQLEEQRGLEFINRSLPEINWKTQAYWACDCVEQVLPLFNERRTLAEDVISFLRENAHNGALDSVEDPVFLDLLSQLKMRILHPHTHSFRHAVNLRNKILSYLLMGPFSTIPAECQSLISAMSMEGDNAYGIPMGASIVWQWRRLLHYINQERQAAGLCTIP